MAELLQFGPEWQPVTAVPFALGGFLVGQGMFQLGHFSEGGVGEQRTSGSEATAG